MLSQTSNGTVKLLVSDLERAQRLIEAIRDEIGSGDFAVSVINGQWFIDWTGPNGDDYFPTGGDSLNGAFVEAMRIAAEDK